MKKLILTTFITLVSPLLFASEVYYCTSTQYNYSYTFDIDKGTVSISGEISGHANVTYKSGKGEDILYTIKQGDTQYGIIKGEEDVRANFSHSIFESNIDDNGIDCELLEKPLGLGELSHSIFKNKLNSSQNIFEELKALFSKSVVADEVDVKGWNSGRCYRYGTPGVPRAQILIGMKTKIDGDNGPLFPDKYESKIMSMNHDSKPENYFDKMTQYKINEVNRLIAKYKSVRSEVKTSKGSLTVKYESQGIEYRIRKYKNYIIMNGVALKDFEEQDIKADDTIVACYYFKLVKK